MTVNNLFLLMNSSFCEHCQNLLLHYLLSIISIVLELCWLYELWYFIAYKYLSFFQQYQQKLNKELCCIGDRTRQD